MAPGRRSATASKRAIDIIGAVLGLAFAAVPMGVVAVAIRITIGRPVLFRQVRPGLHARPFTIRKFRTMRDAIGPDGHPLPDEERVTRFGRLLRSTSLDELPELWNVFRGDMSLVGPRPLLVEYLDLYSSEQARRHDLRPGLTGLAQVRGRNATSWEERLALDVQYVDTWSIPGDIAILVQTIGLVVRRRGISAEGHATMPKFTGSPPTVG